MAVDFFNVLLVAIAIIVVCTIFLLLGSTTTHGKPKSKLEKRGIIGLATDQFLGRRKFPTESEVIRLEHGRKVDVSTGEIYDNLRMVIIGWIDRETGEVIPNPEAARVAKDKGVCQP